MSSQKGNVKRERPQAHQNRHAFRNNLHDSSPRTKAVNQLEFGGLCLRCKEILDWKVKYKKYKLLTQPRKCVRCDKRCIRDAYLTVCSQCARQRAECPKCGQQRELTPVAAANPGNPAASAAASTVARSLESQMLQLRERDKRTFLRLLNAETFATSEQAAAWIEARLGGDDFNDDDDEEENDEDDEDSDSEEAETEPGAS